ncbi:MAG TPA: hypothetical protein PLR88_11435 [Bacteroidales bacterium]|nr:hypothetical protein [Bacteroidales bacterium]
MKKTLLFSMAFFLILGNIANSQVSGMLKKAKNAVTNELQGKTGNSSNEPDPEPACACNDAERVLGMGGKLQLDYKELTISVAEDGRILAKDLQSGKFYIIKNDVAQGPYSAGDPVLRDFQQESQDDQDNDPVVKYNNYIIKSGEKYLIKFGGKSYGPYARISNFTITKSKDKFAARVVENMLTTDNESKKMEEAINNAKTDEEKMKLAMEYSQKMQQSMQQSLMENDGLGGLTPKIVTNVTDEPIEQTMEMGAELTLNGNAKYDEILAFALNKVYNLEGKIIMSIKPEFINANSLFINSSNTKYATYNYGTLTFSDGSTLTNLFSPYLVKVDGKVYLAYMYYSPKNNALMRCKIPF